MLGRSLSHYQVFEEIGAGGMGIVYRARDLKLGRDVALKLLPPEWVADKKRLARFEREARTLASLNHPHIGAIHGLEASDEVHVLVLEYVPGETLAERIAKGPMPIGEALGVLKQVAQALEAAHEKGVIHRDLKPANIKITPEGQAKVLDFGLAKHIPAGSGEATASESPTLTREATDVGVILGTAAYMSPEQARGKPVDKRTDIWSFGCVLYEALSGKVAFVGDTVSDTLARILEREPDWNQLPGETPARIRALLRRCLQKGAMERLRDIGDARIEMHEVLRVPDGAETLPGEGVGKRQRRDAAILAALVAFFAIAFAVWSWLRPLPVISGRYSIRFPDEAPLYVGNRPSLAMSPDGSRMVYTASTPGGPQLYLREMDSFESRPIAGTEGASHPFFSPTGEWVGFMDRAARELKKVSLEGGVPAKICDIGASARGASWGDEGRVAFSLGSKEGLYTVPASGGTPQPLFEFALDRGERYRWPDFLPGSRSVLFTLTTDATRSHDDALIAAVSSRTGEKKILIEGGTNPHYVPTGHIVYARAGALIAVPFDIDRLEVTGAPQQLLEGVVVSGGYGSAQFSFSNHGALTYVPGGPEFYHTQPVWVDRDGEVQAIPLPSQGYGTASLSPDGTRLTAWVQSRMMGEIWAFELGSGAATRLTIGRDSDTPIWTPDGQGVTYTVSEPDGQQHLYLIRLDRNDPPTELAKSDFVAAWSWSPDGQWLLYGVNRATTGRDIWLLSMKEDLEPRPLLASAAYERDARFSLDGKWFAYTSDETGRREVYVQPFPGPGRRTQISTEGGEQPLWGPGDGKELFYRRPDRGEVVAVDIKTEPGFSQGMTRVLFQMEGHYGRTFEVTPDGQRFLMISEGPREASYVNVVLNWLEELKRLVPAGR